MWDLFYTVRNRHSVRKYQSDMQVENEKLHAILETACFAPSAGDLQSYRIYVVSSKEKRNRLNGAAVEQPFLAEAPICLVFCADTERSANQFGKRGATLFAIQDASIAAAYSQLAVVAAGLASTWVGRFDPEEVRRILDLPPNEEPVALIAVGYPAELPEATPRRRLDDVVVHV